MNHLPFRVRVSDGDLADLRRRLAATRWPDKETVADQSQARRSGAPGALPLLGHSYDWRKETRS